MKVLGAFLVVFSVFWISEAALVGGLSEERRPLEKDDPVVNILPKISSEIRSQVAAKLASGDSAAQINDAPITVLSYKSQVVAGTNYFVKAKVGKSVFHLRIYEPIQGQPSLHGLRGPLKESDPIEYFP